MRFFSKTANAILLLTLIGMTVLFSGCLNTNGKIDIPFDMNFSADYTPGEIHLPADKKQFTILQLADTQLSNPTDKGLAPAFELIEKLVKNSNPDLIALTGDNTEGSKSDKVLAKLIPFLDSLDVPYAAVFGNHDPEGTTKKKLSDLYLSGKNSLFQKGPSNIHGMGNYQVNLIQNDSVKYSFYMLDSNRYRSYTTSQKRSSLWGGKNYDYIYPDQIAWYAYNVKKTADLNGAVVPSLAFFHIAIPEFRLYADAPESDILIEQSKDGEPVCNGYVNTGLFDVMKELGSTKGAFIGHDHINNYVFRHEGIILGYGLKTGKTSYYDEDLQGGTLITLSNDFTEIEVEHLYKADLQ